MYSLLFLLVGATLTAIFSAVFGVAGGMMLFVLLSLVLDAKSAVPLHAIVQLVSNFSRVMVGFQQIERAVVGRFVLLILPGVWLGSMLYRYTNPQLLELAIGCMILVMLFLPKKLSVRLANPQIFVLLGFVSGFLGMIVGVVGPLISPFFLHNDIRKERMVATKAACQSIVHLIKIPTFGFLVEFDYQPYYGLIAGLCAVTVVGTWAGKNLIQKISDEAYQQWEKRVLVVLSLLIIAKAAWALYMQG